jgi:transcriptional regulator with XRE-family HTH domain
MNLLLQQIILIRKNLGLSQRDFANKIGMTHTHYNAIEKGRKNITIDILERIATATNTRLVITFISKKYK